MPLRRNTVSVPTVEEYIRMRHFTFPPHYPSPANFNGVLTEDGHSSVLEAQVCASHRSL